MQIELLAVITNKIMKKYLLEKDKAEAFAKDLIEQIQAHGGDPQNEEQTERSIDVVVKRWIEKGY
jgi:hypothetical protein